MCISVRFCARAGWTPALACPQCGLARAMKVRQADRDAARAGRAPALPGFLARLRALISAAAGPQPG